MDIKKIQAFDRFVNPAHKVILGVYVMPTKDRLGLVFPKGVNVTDTDLSKIFTGDGTTSGGVAVA